MNGKKAKALRRLERALEQEKLAFQEMLRRGTPVPVKTMSMDDFNKARAVALEEGAEAAKVADAGGGIGVIATTPRTPDVDPDALAAEMDRANAIEQEVKIGLLKQNVKHYISLEEMETRVDQHFATNDQMTLTREDAFKQISPELLLESRRAAKMTGDTPSAEELDRMHASMNGPEAYAKIGSMGSNPPYRVSDAHGDRGVAVPVFPDKDIPQVGGYLKEPKMSPDPLHARGSVVFERSPAMIDLIDKTQERLADIRKGDKTNAS